MEEYRSDREIDQSEHSDEVVEFAELNDFIANDDTEIAEDCGSTGNDSDKESGEAAKDGDFSVIADTLPPSASAPPAPLPKSSR